ncbi:MAG: hypothetical protein GXO66_02920 [Euryarchaeota archaeon]|nr:hypothetical protein [Euryarchaeota archaeon]
MIKTFRGIDEEVFRKFKAEAVRQGVSLGRALTGAMKLWLDKQKKPGKRGSLLQLKPVDWGKGTERASVEVDEILYGD